MCIRDRFRLAALVDRAITEHRPGHRQHLHLGVPVAPAEPDELTTCLLYTSDAADERSSVDLGGRRIIKKKKKQENDDKLDTQKTRKTKKETAEH